jgi:putative ABC transport system permease protein
MNNFWKDVRHGTRLLARNPGLTVVAVLALTLGIGLTATMFSIVYGVLFRGLPFDDAKQIVHIEESNLPEGENSLEVPIHDYLDWKAQQRSFTHLAAFYDGTVQVSGTEKAVRMYGAYVTPNLFPLLGVQPLLGRTLRDDEATPGGELVTVIGYNVWQTRYEADPNIIGKAIRVNGTPATIVGVMPEKFLFPENQEIWLPLRIDPLKFKRREGETLEVVGRLRPGQSIDDAALELISISKRMELENPVTNKNIRPVLKPFTDEYIGAEPRALLFTMLGAVVLVLLIACTNVANLLLGRAVLRSKEVGIRTALGASRWRLVTQFLTEALVLSLAGAALGTGIAFVGTRLFNNAIASAQPPFWIAIQVDGVALGFVLLLALVSSLFAGAIPALQASRSQVTDVLKDESRGASSFRLGRISRALVVFEIALSCALLVAAGLTIKSVVQLRNIDLGFDAENLFTARIGLPTGMYDDAARQRLFFEQVLTKVSAEPGVRSATLATGIPGTGDVGRWTFALEGVSYAREQDQPSANRTAIGANYFETLGLKPTAGRLFNEADRMGALPVVIVNRSFVQKYFANQDPLGRRMRVGGSRSSEPWLTIVGVVPDATAGDPDNKEPDAYYVPFAQYPARFMSIIARTAAQPMTITNGVRELVNAVDSDVAMYFPQTLREAIGRETWFYNVFGVLFMIFGFAALLLASIGLYAVMAFSVSQRTREVGIRMAIGAQAGDVLRMILRQGLLQVTIGMVIGLALAAFVSNLLTIILFNVQPRDPSIFGSIVFVLSTTALLACLLPARRATRVDPLEALRYE